MIYITTLNSKMSMGMQQKWCKQAAGSVVTTKRGLARIER